MRVFARDRGVTGVRGADVTTLNLCGDSVTLVFAVAADFVGDLSLFFTNSAAAFAFSVGFGIRFGSEVDRVSVNVLLNCFEAGFAAGVFFVLFVTLEVLASGFRMTRALVAFKSGAGTTAVFDFVRVIVVFDCTSFASAFRVASLVPDFVVSCDDDALLEIDPRFSTLRAGDATEGEFGG